MLVRAAIALLPALLGAAVIEDFATAPAVSLVRESERGVTAAYAEPAAGAGKALVLRYAEKHGSLAEVYFAKALPIPGPGTATLRVRCTPELKVWGIALRVKGAQGECFQFKGAPAPGAEWTTITFDVAEAAAQGHWGNPGDGVMQAPWSIAGVAASGGEGPVGGEVWIDDLAFTPATGK